MWEVQVLLWSMAWTAVAVWPLIWQASVYNLGPESFQSVQLWSRVQSGLWPPILFSVFLLTCESWEIIHLQIGQLELVGWPRLLYRIQNALGKALPKGLSVCHGFIFLRFACWIISYSMWAGKAPGMAFIFLRICCYIASFFWSQRGLCWKVRILTIIPGIKPFCFQHPFLGFSRSYSSAQVDEDLAAQGHKPW